MRPIQILLLTASLSFAHNSPAQTCNLNSFNFKFNNRYSFSTDATVIDYYTGLMWTRCAIEQSPSNNCTNSPTMMSYAEALQVAKTVSLAGKNDWRLPSLHELETIVDRNCYAPAINLTAFPNTSGISFWTSLPSTVLGNAWVVDFMYGFVQHENMKNNHAVRLVRTIATYHNYTFDMFRAKWARTLTTIRALKYSIAQCLHESSGFFQACNSLGSLTNPELSRYAVQIPAGKYPSMTKSSNGYNFVTDPTADWDMIYIGTKSEIVIKGGYGLMRCTLSIAPSFNNEQKIIWTIYAHNETDKATAEGCTRLVRKAIPLFTPPPLVGGDSYSN
jgi:hypothetical protein